MASNGAVSNERVRDLISAPDVATYAEIAALAQEVIDERQNAPAHAMNRETVREQQLEIAQLKARIDVLTRIVSQTPVDELVANVKRAAEVQAHEVKS